MQAVAMKWLALMLLALTALFAAPRAEAVTTCGITSITNLAFGAVDPTGTSVDTTATINYSCTYTGFLGILYGSYITMCVSLGQDDLGNLAPRTMIDPLGDRMQYNVYKDATRTAIWGVVNNVTYAPLTVTAQVPLLTAGNAITGSVVAYGRVPAGQSSLSPGNYTGTITGGTTGTALTYSYNEALLSIGTYPASCTAGGTAAAATVAGPSTSVTASVAPKCTLATATDLNFGSVPGLLRTNTDQTSLIRATCTNRAAYQVGLSNGQNASGSVRRMAGGGRFVTYELYRDAQRTLRWGSALNTDTQPGTGSGSEQTLTVYGRVPIQSAAVAGTYSDVVTITVTY
ncbi:Csu type fimbrial protein [Luteibacter sp.]|uniref:Csu type fimbrial protein n=1 Tax=Luteibacter sp. TaxID=1886636 RepID=UPI003F7D91D4